MPCFARLFVGGGLNARVVIEITVAMNNEKERERERESGEGGKGVCLFVRPHHTLFGWGQTNRRTNERERPSYEATCVIYAVEEEEEEDKGATAVMVMEALRSAAAAAAAWVWWN